MPKFIIQREYLLPVYQYEADTFEEARAEAAGPGHDWYNAEEDYDGSLPTTITNAKMVDCNRHRVRARGGTNFTI